MMLAMIGSLVCRGKGGFSIENTDFFVSRRDKTVLAILACAELSIQPLPVEIGLVRAAFTAMDPFEHNESAAGNLEAYDSLIATQPDSFMAHDRKGDRPMWFFGKRGKEKVVYAAWANENGEPLAKAGKNSIPSMPVITPAGRIDQLYINMSSVFYGDGDTKRVAQVIKYAPPERQPANFQRYLEVFGKFYTEDLARALATNLSKHDMLTDDLRELGEKDPAALESAIIDSIRSEFDKRFFAVDVKTMKRKIRKDYTGDGISPHDEVILDVPGFDPDGKVRKMLEDHGGCLNLINFVMPDKSKCSVSQYSQLSPDGMIAAARVVDYGIYFREDAGSHSVMRGLTDLNVITNGTPRQTGNVALDFSSIQKRSAEEEAPAEKKKPRKK